MSSVRRDIFTGAYIIVSELRGKRPISVSIAEAEEARPERCPFCPGNELLTPEPLKIGEEGWQTRSFPNKYPALASIGDLLITDPLYGSYDGAGQHEIFVDTRNHDEDLKDFSKEHLEKVFIALKERYEFYRADKRITHVQVFKNRGSKAGATQKHSHWQLLAGKFVPLAQETILNRLAEYRSQTGECMYCAVIKKELMDGRRIVFENERFAVITPYASRFTYETWVVPKRHVSFFSELESEDFFFLSEALLNVIIALEDIKEGMDYNLILMDGPKTDTKRGFHWHIQALPRMGNLAGYEFSTGSYINHITPENAAKALRKPIMAFGGNI